MKKRTFFQGLQGKLLLFFLAISLIPLIIVSSVSFQRSKSGMQGMGQEMLADTADGLMRTIDVMMNDRQDDIKTWASLPAVSAGLQSKNYGEVTSLLASIEKGYDIYKYIMLFDAAGNMVAANDPGLLTRSDVQRNQNNHEWFQRAMKGEITVSDVAYSDTAKENVVSFSAPVKGAGGKIIGVITSRMSWDIVEKIVDEEKSGLTGHAYLVNKDGIIIAHPKKEKVLKEDLLKVQSPALAEQAKKMVKGEKGEGEYTYEGINYLAAFEPSKGFGDYKGLGWSYVVAQGTNEIYAPVNTLRNIVFVIVIVAAILIALLAIFIARSIANPMIKGVAFAQIVAAGDLSQTLEVRSKDEVGDLANALNAMVEKLREMIGKIRDSSNQVASASDEISAGSVQLNRAAHNQASAAEETSSTMVQMAASILTVAGNADALASNVEEVSSSVDELGASSEQVSKSAEIMASSVAETSSTIEQMTVSIDRVAQSAEELASSVTETSSTIEQMTVSIDQVAGNTQELQQVATETAAIIEQLAVSIRESAKNVNTADDVAKAAAKEGAAGQEAVQQALAAMERVGNVIEKTAASITNLGKRSEEIGSIVKVINEIADQTNLLALNAAIEAARAGDAGRGFAVVAEEVRKLAERSVNATKEIGEVIKQVQADTNDSVKYGELAAQEARSSMELSGVAGNALANIVKNIERTSTLMSDISLMTGEQANASGQVLKSVERMTMSTSQVANAAREQAQGGKQIRVAVERMNIVTQEVTGATREQAMGSKQIRIAVENMNNVTQQVSIATREQALSARQIVEAVNSMNGMTLQVANATAEQKKGGDMVVQAVETISDSARENLSSVEQLSRSAQGLSQQAADLADMVAQFKVQ
ncbi:MAG: hypothetical protein CXR31_09155 [Geobacter sp.]|nr:MAG: hypothetical protein CXR31_09155 [Geobacter sp.]